MIKIKISIKILKWKNIERACRLALKVAQLWATFDAPFV
jgi:hypothetical protein